MSIKINVKYIHVCVCVLYIDICIYIHIYINRFILHIYTLYTKNVSNVTLNLFGKSAFELLVACVINV